MKLSIMVLMTAACAGCATFEQLDATRSALDDGLVQGVSPASQFDAMMWCWPTPALGPYTELSGFTATVTNGPNLGQHIAFFLGKTLAGGEWQVFAAQTYSNGVWHPIPVRLPVAQE